MAFPCFTSQITSWCTCSSTTGRFNPSLAFRYFDKTVHAPTTRERKCFNPSWPFVTSITHVYQNGHKWVPQFQSLRGLSLLQQRERGQRQSQSRCFNPLLAFQYFNNRASGSIGQGSTGCFNPSWAFRCFNPYLIPCFDSERQALTFQSLLRLSLLHTPHRGVLHGAKRQVSIPHWPFVTPIRPCACNRPPQADSVSIPLWPFSSSTVS